MDIPLGTGDAPRIRIGDITAGTGLVVGSTMSGNYFSDFLFISCDQANNIYNSASKNAPIVAELVRCIDQPWLLKWSAPFEI